jgi:TPP-dependent pyruvate/acetoin dehydrogenase alpha subunit
MIRYPAYDPPEYLNWKPNPDLLREYRSALEQDENRRRLVDDLTHKELLALYAGLLKNRLHDITLKRWVKQGVISKAWLGTGEEAVTIGAVHALDRSPAPDGLATDFVAPMIRNAGACHEMGMSLAGMFRGYLGTDDSPTRGRDLHIGDLKKGVLAPISQVGAMAPIAAGVAISFKQRKQARIALTWAGDGSTKTGMFHEGMNLAAVQRLPMIVIVQNNHVALGTTPDRYLGGPLVDLPQAYGVKGWGFNGNNVLDTYASVRLAANSIRFEPGSGPFLLIAETFRMGGHATHDEREARQVLPAELFEYWGKRDPIGLYETFLVEGQIELADGRQAEPGRFSNQNREILNQIEAGVTAEIEQAAEQALASVRLRQPAGESAAEGVYSSSQSLIGAGAR